jgi:selenide,water dikinase
LDDYQKALLCDPQTSGGLLIAVEAKGIMALETILRDAGIEPYCIGELLPRTNGKWVYLR